MERQLEFHGLQNVSGVAAFSQTTEVDGDQKNTRLHTACLVSSLRFVNYIRGQACASISGGVLANFFSSEDFHFNTCH